MQVALDGGDLGDKAENVECLHDRASLGSSAASGTSALAAESHSTPPSGQRRDLVASLNSARSLHPENSHSTSVARRSWRALLAPWPAMLAQHREGCPRRAA